MRNDFVAFILSHGRPNKVYTYNSLRKAGYTGRIVIVIDDEDKQGDAYRQKFGDQVVTFSKAEVEAEFDTGDNFQDRRAVFFARNACWKIARELGVQHFVQLDDDYQVFTYTANDKRVVQKVHKFPIKSMDRICELMCEYLDAGRFSSIAFVQVGDLLGGVNGGYALHSTLRKCMNSFFCNVDRPFRFSGRINEDVNTYTCEGNRGSLFLTIMDVSLKQAQTQSNSGGMSEIYAASGTYVKSFYSVMYCPAFVKIREMQSTHKRLHHSINWNAAVPKILPERYRKFTG
jgi:hypothetical protein